MKQPDINTMEVDLKDIYQLSPLELLDVLHDLDIIEVFYVSDKVFIRRKDTLKEDFHV